ncbi:asparaginase [Isoptericola variabilis]|uniref:Asparaginase n=1 Tax=Isoptericola variabilis (strain 225) TaxID=743718 RepID=F6FST3_ISOV2|nr:asparaginase [Isoptericola variabilis]AEG43074.1 Asparaginase [Isoptericola variabilis 225]TWH35001.1 L-asparaginase [Isoptericola variabilis J7]
MSTDEMNPRSRVRSILGRWVAPAAVAALVAGAVTHVTAPDPAPAAAPVTVESPTTSARYDAAVASVAAMAKNGTKPKVTLVATGGTIAGVAQGRDTFSSYRAGTITGEELVAQLQPELGAIADVDVVQFGNSGSSGYTIAQFHALTRTVEDALKGSDGVVVTTGTDTQEEFAYWLDLTVQSQKPVVTTGAMRPWQDGEGDQVFGADGPANLYNAVKLAASQATFCYGTVLMLNDEIHAARDVTKTNSYRMDTFQSREYGVLGWVDQNDITLGRATPRVQACDRPQDWMTPFDLSTVEGSEIARTEIVYSYQEAGGESIAAFHQAGVDGIVTAGTGAGGISRAMGQARTAAANDGVVFLTTTRTGSGSVYGGSGNVIAGGDLTPIKARLLLALSLTFSDDVEQVRTWVEQVGNPEFTPTGRGNGNASPKSATPGA